MKLALITLFIISVGIASAYADNMLLFVGSAGGAPVVLTNLRITNTGAFRTINTGDNRAVAP